MTSAGTSAAAAPAAGELNNAAQRAAAHYRRTALSPSIVSGGLRLVEFGLLVASGLALFVAYVGLSTHLVVHYPVAILLASTLVVIASDFAGNYRLRTLRQPFLSAARFVLIWSGTLALIAFLGFFLKIAGDFSRFWVGAWFLAGAALILGTRLVMVQMVRRWAREGRMERRAVIVGGGAAAERLIHSIAEQADSDIRICGIFDDRNDDRSPPVVAGYPKLGNIGELIAFARIAHIDMLIVSLPVTAESRLLSLMNQLWVLPVDIRLAADNSSLRYRPRTYSYIGSLPMLDMADKPIADWDYVAKRCFDIVFSLIGILLFLPVMIATAVAIKLDSRGPVLFRQKRLGFNNEVIEVFKFRSMYSDQCDPTARNAVVRDDPRVTRVGRFIRKASIDELPQFFNVLRGELSLVGPRPHAVSGQTRHRLYHDVVDGYFARHRVKPGVTGWAQINGWRGEIDSDEKIRMRTEFDLYYIENWSLWFDLKILLLTPFRLLDTKNAY
ncbi:MAG: undecaprenyl-phosphate glucose phosphotransferase [Aquamicrobium sp.]|uniref:undecaprenyl-phosphate glucose phosphotransferase n=1 Tax=Aquamicrobium sp. TaxID=1872579 RepID=UPI00349EBEDB|nr:undecaprenyl-phosphate glucose phosphotransferase [Aquamicrobium sp.]